MNKSISRLKLGALLLGGVGLCAGTGLALSPASNNGGQTGKAPMQIREDDNSLIRDVKMAAASRRLCKRWLQAWSKSL